MILGTQCLRQARKGCSLPFFRLTCRSLTFESGVRTWNVTPPWTPVGGFTAPQFTPAQKADGMSMVQALYQATVQGDELSCESVLQQLTMLKQTSSAQLKHALDMLWGEENQSVLHAASQKSQEKLVNELLSLGASAHVKDAEGQTPLHYAAAKNTTGIARQLINRGRANVDARDAKGQTPLLVSAVAGSTNVGRLLTRFRANPTAADANGNTPMSLASSEKGGLGPWLTQYHEKRDRTDKRAGRVMHYKQPLANEEELPAMIVAPYLKLTLHGYQPFEDGILKNVPRGIRNKKKRHQTSTPRGVINWYQPRG